MVGQKFHDGLNLNGPFSTKAQHIRDNVLISYNLVVRVSFIARQLKLGTKLAFD